MNSKFSTLFISIYLLNLSSCGVKSNPIAPSGSSLPSYIESFYKKDLTPKKEINKKKKKIKASK